ncbi:hypothetical protein [Bythopirellula goksoeyrii]|uniref:Secreted protein n=1 Tax=Bythopirellula goksoeyrii TaxID=1400387 RepID=A0A5B9QDT1_9BACT|nr:hypothetical protein [Bythopirellula goksoeyrii]QEG35790.1 hypothetical protein Pr1d_30960 [Bythopirellula goksoeyrii]
MLRQRRIVVSLFTLVAVLAASSSVFAQRDRIEQRTRPTGQIGSWSNQRASRSVQHARNYSRDIYRYSRDAKSMEPAVAKSQSEELGRNITKAQQELVTVQKEVGSDPAAVSALKSINEHLAAAVKHHKMLHEECCKDSVDGSICMNCCNTIILELDKAQAEHDALMRSMEMKEKPSN